MTDIYLTDPAGGGMTIRRGVIVVQPLNLRIVATLEDIMPVFDVGELRVTQAALDKLGVNGVKAAFVDHLKGVDWCTDPEDRALNHRARENGGVVYNVDHRRRIMCITYPGDNSTLITSVEY